MYLFNLEFLKKNVQEARSLMNVIDFCQQNDLHDAKKKSKDLLILKLKEVNLDEYYTDYDFFQTRDEVNKEASKYFVDETDEFLTFLSATMSLNQKIKPLNNLSLRDSLKEVQLVDINQSTNETDEKKWGEIIGNLIKSFSIDNKETFFLDYKELLHDSILSIELNEFVKQISSELFIQNKHIIPVLYSTIIESSKSYQSEMIKSQNYERAAVIREFISFLRVEYLIFGKDDFEECIVDFDVIYFDFLLKKDFNKGLDFIERLVSHNREHKLLREISVRYGKLNNLRYYYDLGCDLLSFLSILLKLKYLSSDRKNLITAFFCYNLGSAVSSRIEYTQKYLDRIKSEEIKSELFDLIWLKSFQNLEYDFLMMNFSLWRKDVKNVKLSIKTFKNQKLDSNLNKIYELADKETYFRTIIELYLENEKDADILQLYETHPEYQELIKTIHMEIIDNYLRHSIEIAVRKDNCIEIPRLLSKFPDKVNFVEEIVEVELRSRHIDMSRLMNDDEIMTLLTLFHNNFNILKYLVFEKAKRNLALNEDSELTDYFNSVLDINVWALALK